MYILDHQERDVEVKYSHLKSSPDHLALLAIELVRHPLSLWKPLTTTHRDDLIQLYPLLVPSLDRLTTRIMAPTVNGDALPTMANVFKSSPNGQIVKVSTRTLLITGAKS